VCVCCVCTRAVYVCAHIYVCVHVCVSVYMCVCVCVYMCVCVCVIPLILMLFLMHTVAYSQTAPRALMAWKHGVRSIATRTARTRTIARVLQRTPTKTTARVSVCYVFVPV